MADHDPDDDEVLMDDAAADPGDIETRDESFLDKLRGSGVGTEDPTIVGDAGPTDIPPGTDNDTANATPLVTTDEPVDHLEV